jgi:carboxylesterase
VATGDIWDLQKAMSRRLLIWSGLSVLAGVALLLAGGPFLRGFGIQAAAWGAIDAAIAAVVQRTSRRSQPVPSDPSAAGLDEKRARRLRRLLWINTGLDVCYVTGGIVLANTLGRSEVAWRGHGWGIVVQGGFLFFFDWIHAQNVPVTLSFELPPLFDGPQHQPFTWEGGRPAALLIHGFPDTPAAMRPLGGSLHAEGWTVQGILLPGFGTQIPTLPWRRYREWVDAAREALSALQQRHSPVVLVGYSMGAAIAILAADSCPPDGIVLLAPFWRLGSWLQDAALSVVRPFLPRTFRPLARADLGNPQIRHVVASLLPQLDLDDVDIQRLARKLDVPLTLVDQVRMAGRQAYRQARRIQAPVLIVQGMDDEVVLPRHTRRLARRLGRRPRYSSIEGGHVLTDPASPGWETLTREVKTFIRALCV